MTKKKYRILIIILVCLFLIFAAAALYMFRDRFENTDGVATKNGFDREKAQQYYEKVPEETDTDGKKSDAKNPAKKYECPVDFKKLKKINPDVYAWIDIPGTVVSYPVMQNPNEDKYYLNHNSDGYYSIEGALFTEHYYNHTDFNDPMTVIYGHFMSDGSLFGSLQKDYSNPEFFKKHRDIYIYMEDCMKKYTVFAAVPYSSLHLLQNYNFSSPRVFEAFFADVLSTRDMSASLDESAFPEYGDKILTLSTCLWGNNRQRYLVFAAEHDEINKK